MWTSVRPQPHLYRGCHQRIFAAVAGVSSALSIIFSAALASDTNSSLTTSSSATTSTTKSEPSGEKPNLAKDQTYEVQILVMDDPENMNQAAHLNMTNSSAKICVNGTINYLSDCLPPLPKDLTFSDDNIVSVATYSCLFVIAACGNLTVFITLFRNRKAKSRINMFIMHLAIADLIVTFVMMPLEIAWNSTVVWLAGDAACRMLTFFRAMGFYLSSCILVSISLDRYFAIMRPLSITDADRRARMMLVVSWLLSIIASIPQSIIFHVERHPVYRWFKQCVTFNFFPSPDHELAYNIFSIIALYGLPLAIITSAYCVILFRISKKSRQSKDEISGRVFDRAGGQEHGGLRRSGVGNIERAKSRTLKMTLVIVGAYVMCWTPYFVISAWYYFDRASALLIDNKVQRGLFIFAVSNSCINPIVYGMFTIKFKRELIRCCYCLRGTLKRRRQEDSNGIRRSLLVPLKRNSESSSSSRNNDRLGRGTGQADGASTPQGCRYSFVSPLAEVKASSSRGSLTSVGREDRGVNFFTLGRDERVGFGPVGSSLSMERSSTGNFSSREDRANLNNFIRIGSADC